MRATIYFLLGIGVFLFAGYQADKIPVGRIVVLVGFGLYFLIRSETYEIKEILDRILGERNHQTEVSSEAQDE